MADESGARSGFTDRDPAFGNDTGMSANPTSVREPGPEFGTAGGAGVLEPAQEQGLRGGTHELKERARESGRDLLDQAVEKKDELKARASTMVDDGRHRAADRAGTLARALHGTAETLEQDGDAQLSQWVHTAADQVDRVVGYLNGHDAGGLMRDMEDLARRNPALFLGGTYAAGLVLGRFLRASAPERRVEHERDARDRSADSTATASAAEQHWPGSTTSYRDGFQRDAGSESSGSSWTGVGVSPEGASSGHTTGGRTEESLQRGQDLGGTPGYGAAGAGDGIPDDREREV